MEVKAVDLEDFRRYLLSRGYREGNVNRLISLVKRILEAGNLEEAEKRVNSKWMRVKLRYAWRKWEEYNGGR